MIAAIEIEMTAAAQRRQVRIIARAMIQVGAL
jgi:hypothetical protein